MKNKKLLAFMFSICVVLVFAFAPMWVNAGGTDVDIDMGNTNVPEQTLTIDKLAGKYKVQGRTTVINNILMTDYSASGMEFEAECEGDVFVTFNATSLISGDDGGCYFTVIVDGVRKDRDFCHITANGDTTVKIAEGLAAGKHTFEIYRQTEIEHATIGIKSITLAGNMLDAPENNDLYIEFVGDSITTAYGNLTLGSTNPTHPAYPLHQDATQGYAYLTAKALGADWSLVARQGIGASVGYQPVSMDTVYPLLRHHKDSSTAYDFAREPDYVVIALGTNDINTYNNTSYANPVKTLDDVKQGFADMLALVREKNPNAKIVWAYNMMTSKANDLITAVIDEAGGADKGYYSAMLTQDATGGNGHPYYTAHQTMANELAKFINGIENPSTHTPGNINGDSNDYVDLQDVVALAQVVAGWEGVAHIEDALDVDGNGAVNLQDVVILAQYVAGWDVEIK